MGFIRSIGYSEYLECQEKGWLVCPAVCSIRWPGKPEPAAALVEERVKTIAELNHHIRNALQVIKFLGGQRFGLDAVQLQLINDSADRIEWALREVDRKSTRLNS